MAGVVISDQRMDSDGGAPAGDTADQQCLPERARRCAVPDTGEQEKACRGDSAAKPCAVVGDERDETRIDRVELPPV